MWGEAPANGNATKFGTGVDVQSNHICQILRWKFKWFGFYRGRILVFTIDFAHGP